MIRLIAAKELSTRRFELRLVKSLQRIEKIKSLQHLCNENVFYSVEAIVKRFALQALKQ